jgi:hypothetical protein
MTIYITCTEGPHGTTLRVDGWLEGEEIDELLQVVQAAPPPVVLNLTDLRSADAGGVRALRQLAAQGVQLTGVSDYLELLMQRASDNQVTEDPEGGKVE